MLPLFEEYQEAFGINTVIGESVVAPCRPVHFFSVFTKNCEQSELPTTDEFTTPRELLGQQQGSWYFYGCA